MTLTDLLAQLEERAAAAEREGATAPVANVYRLVAEELRSLAQGYQRAPVHAGAASDRLLTVAEAATILNVLPRWLYRRSQTLPFARHLGHRTLRFSEAGLRRWMEHR